MRTAIVTGGSRGIGRAVAIKLASEGVKLVVGYAGNSQAAQDVVQEITAAGGSAVAAQADVADEAEVAAMFEQASDGVDIVVNCAGIMTLSPVAEIDLDALDRMHRTNIRGAFVVAREAARRLRDGGSLVMVSTSVVGLQIPAYAGYAASKGAVEAMTLILAREMRGRDITVNTVAPGPTATSFFLDGKDQETIDRMAQQPPLERLGTPEDAAEAIAFLTGPHGHWINGQTIRSNGGII